jgi:hypothetical protein
VIAGALFLMAAPAARPTRPRTVEIRIVSIVTVLIGVEEVQVTYLSGRVGGVRKRRECGGDEVYTVRENVLRKGKRVLKQKVGR